MALDKFTQITKSGIVTTINFECHHLHSTGIATFSAGSISALDGTFSGDVSIGGTLTYQDVTNIDSVGLVTARLGINVTAGVSTFAAAIDANGGVDISGGSGLVASTAKISDLTDNRVVIGGSSGELEDSANLTFDGSNLGVGSKVTVTNANADSRNLNSLGADINAAWIRIGDKAAAKTFTNGLGIKFYDQGTAHWSTGTIGNQYYVSYTGSAGDELFPSSRVDALTFNTTGAAVFASDITAGGNLYIPDKIYHSGDTDTFISFPAANTITAETGGEERLRIDSTGRIGIGTNSPAYFISIENTAPYIRVKDTAAPTDEKIWDFNAGTDGILRFRNTNDAANSSNNWLEVERDGVTTSSIRLLTASGSERLRIHSTGELQIGDSTKSSLSDRVLQIGKTDRSATYLEIRSSTSGVVGLVLSDGTSGDAGYRGTIEYTHNDDNMFFKTAASERLRIDSDGRVLIGQTSSSSSSKLCVYGAVSTEEAFFELNRTDDPANNQNIGVIEFSQGSAASRLAARIMTRRDGGVWGASSLPTRFEFHTCVSGSNTAAERVRISSNGNLNILDGDLQIGTSGHGIDFSAHANAGGATSELLDDYEEGTYVPTLNFAGSFNGTISSQTGTYTKIGRVVHVNVNLQLSNKGTTTGQLRFTLPFNCANILASTSVEAGGSITYFNNYGGNASTLIATCVDANDYVVIRGNYQGGDNFTVSDSSVDTNFEFRCSITYFAAS